MKKYLNKKYAEKLLVIGSSLFIVSVVINLVTVFSAYDKVDDCLGESINCKVSTQEIISNIAIVIGYAGIGVVIAGMMILIIASIKQKKK